VPVAAHRQRRPDGTFLLLAFDVAVAAEIEPQAGFTCLELIQRNG